MAASKPPTQKEIAERCGVSKMTVALVLGTASRHEGAEKRVSQAVREKIQRTAKSLGYRPDRQAQLLRGARSGLIGYLSFTTFVPSQIKLGYLISQAVKQSDYAVYSAQVLSDPTELEEDIHAMLDLRVEGICMLGAATARFLRSKKLIDACRAAQTPVVLACAESTTKLPVVGYDERGGMYALTRHVLATGAKRLVYMTLMTEKEEASEFSKYSDRARLEGFRDAVREAGLPGDSVRILRQPHPRTGSEDYEAGYLAGEQLSYGDALPDAVICFSDSCAVGLIGALNQNGIKVPDDIRVAGFGDSAVGRYFGVPLTTVRLPLEAIADRAVSTLMGRIRDDAPKTTQKPSLFPCEVVHRESTGPHS